VRPETMSHHAGPFNLRLLRMSRPFVQVHKYMINNGIPRMTVYNPFVGLFSGCLCDLGCSSSCGFESAEWRSN
jgi:hypothetical protein